MTTSLIIDYSNPYDKKKQKSITDINPNATTQEMLDFSQTIINLTNNSYSKTTRIDKTELDSESKQTRTISKVVMTGNVEATLVDGVYSANVKASDVSGNPAAMSAIATVSGTNNFSTLTYLADFQAPSSWFVANLRINYSSSSIAVYPATRDTSSIVGNVISFTIILPADETYKTLTIPIKITITEG